MHRTQNWFYLIKSRPSHEPDLFRSFESTSFPLKIPTLPFSFIAAYFTKTSGNQFKITKQDSHLFQRRAGQVQQSAYHSKSRHPLGRGHPIGRWLVCRQGSKFLIPGSGSFPVCQCQTDESAKQKAKEKMINFKPMVLMTY